MGIDDLDDEDVPVERTYDTNSGKVETCLEPPDGVPVD